MANLHTSTRSFFLTIMITGAIANCGAAQGQAINQDLKLTASDGAANDIFGWSIAIDDGIVAATARWHDDNGSNSGAAYLYSATSGVQLAELLPNDGAANDEFGYSISIDNGIVAIGSRLDDDNGSNSGSAYLFDATTGAQLAKLLPSGGAEFDFFGWSIAIDDGIVAVGARGDDDNGTFSGSAYVFDATTGTQIAKLLPTDGAAGDQFGRSIAIDNGVVAVGANFDDDNGNNSGSAYLFNATTGEQLAKLLPGDGATLDEFGFSIAIDSGVVAVGAHLDDDNGDASGSAYLFDVSTGSQLFKLLPELLPSDNVVEQEFGYSIDMDLGVIAVGAYGDDDGGTNAGSAYLFSATTGEQVDKLLASDAGDVDQFGVSIGFDNSFVAVGAFLDDDNGGNSGSAYVFDTRCLADVNHDGILTPADFTAWIAAFNASAPECDQNDDGICTPADFTSWIANFNTGC